jgi:N-acetylglutamate synthase-like GNAT family acetyltransferase
MSLKSRIETLLEFENVAVGERTTEDMTGRNITTYSVNKGGVVLQFAISADETDEGVIEDFLEYIESRVHELD